MNSDQMVWLCVIMLTATAVKLLLWFYCRSSAGKIVHAYAEDDVITNGVGLAAAVLGHKFYWRIDPFGAIMLALYKISNWSGTVLEHAVCLIGQSAPPAVLQKLTYLVLRYHSQITRIDTVRAYSFGFLYFVEVDIQLPEVERAYLFIWTTLNEIISKSSSFSLHFPPSAHNHAKQAHRK